MIDKERLVDEFIKQVRIDSPSRDEKALSCYLKGLMEGFGAEVISDKADHSTGGNAGNLICRIRGKKRDAPVIMLSAHMDTVSPGRGIKPVIRDGIIYSEGDTILGSDDKSGIAIIIEVLKSLIEEDIPYGDIEVVFTVCEEVGILGAKALDVTKLQADFGYALDSTDSCSIVYAAPAANHIKFTINGLESHAGLAPEKGINAIQLAGKAISMMPLGRIDEETTANIGLIEGGSATNITAGKVVMEGEARSHSAEKLKDQTNRMVNSVKEIVDGSRVSNDLSASCHIEISLDYPVMRLGQKSAPLMLAEKSAKKLGMEFSLRVGGGGSDANILNSKGIETVIIGTGMENVHTNKECIKKEDMVKAAIFLETIILENAS